MKKKIPDLLKIEDIVPIYWAEVSEWNSRHSPAKFFNMSKGKADPLFRYLVITTGQYPGFDEFYLVCYFDRLGNWITQSAFDTLKEALDHGEHAFGVRPEHWFDAE